MLVDLFLSQNTSWTWPKIMKLRDSFHACIRFRVGKTFLGMISGTRKAIRAIYVVSCPTSKLCEYIVDGRWNFPLPVSD